MTSDPSNEFKDEIQYLSDRAAQERSRIADKSRPTNVHNPIRKFIWIGAILVFVQLGLFAYLSWVEKAEVSKQVVEPNPLLSQQDCAGEKYRTYRKLVAYMRQHGESPASLDPLVGSVLAAMPVDPKTRRPLTYTKVGKGFRLDCPRP